MVLIKIILERHCRLVHGASSVMDPMGPQVAANAAVSAENAKDCEMTVEIPGLVAPRKDRAFRSLKNWLSAQLDVKPGACKDLAGKLLLGKINGNAPRGQTIRSLCRDGDPEKALRFFSALKIDEDTARRLLSRCRLPFGSRTEASSRKRRHESDADGSEDDDAREDDGVTQGSDDALALGQTADE